MISTQVAAERRVVVVVAAARPRGLDDQNAARRRREGARARAAAHVAELAADQGEAHEGRDVAVAGDEAEAVRERLVR